MAGGQSLGPMLNLRLVAPDTIVDITGLAELKHVEVAGDELVIGACVTHADIEDGRIPDVTRGAMQRVASAIAYRAVRNRGTIGGSLVHADPAADWVAVLPVFPGFAIAVGPQGERRIPLAEFVLGVMETALRTDELLRAVELPVLPDATGGGHWKFCRKPGEFSKAIACVLALPGAAPRAVLAAPDTAPLVLGDAAALLAAPEAEAARIVAGLSLDDPWRAALARVALRKAAEQAT